MKGVIRLILKLDLLNSIIIILQFSFKQNFGYEVLLYS